MYSKVVFLGVKLSSRAVESQSVGRLGSHGGWTKMTAASCSWGVIPRVTHIPYSLSDRYDQAGQEREAKAKPGT